MIAVTRNGNTPFSGARRRALRLLGAGALYAMTPSNAAQAQPLDILKRPIPRSGELLPAVGLGTWQTFDAGPADPVLAELEKVLWQLVELGASVVDTSPMYGESERVVGELSSALSIRNRLFLATKVWTMGREAGIKQMDNSFRLLRTKVIDLMQVHNLLDLGHHLLTLREWKAAGKIRYIGITHYHSSAYPKLERLIKTKVYDFVQFNYSMGEREAETRLLPLCADSGTAVLVNRPFSQAGLFGKVRGKPLPPWAAEFDCTSWAQFFLKYVLAHPAVTCAIPGTRRVSHLKDNLQAGVGRLPDAATRRRMVAYLDRI